MRKSLTTLLKQDEKSSLTCELYLGNKCSFYLNHEGILKCTLVINNLELSIIVVPLTLTNTLLQEFHNCRGHQGCARTLNTLKRKFWWKDMWKHIKYHISNCITCSKNLPNILCHLQLQLEIPEIPFTCIAINTIGKLPTTSSGNRYALTCIDLLTSYVIAVPMLGKTADSVIEAYLSGILSRASTSMVCLSDNGTDLKNSQMNTILKQLGIKHIYSNPYRPQGNSRIENIHNFLKWTLTKFLSSLDAKWDKVLPFTCYCFNSTPTADDLEIPVFLMHGRDPLEGHTGLFCSGDTRYMGDEKGLILFAELRKLWSPHTKNLQENRLLKTNMLECNKNFKSHHFKVCQLIAVKNHLKGTFNLKFISDYQVLDIINEHTLLIQSPNGKTRKININHAKPVSAISATDNVLQDFKQSMLRNGSTHHYNFHSSSV